MSTSRYSAPVIFKNFDLFVSGICLVLLSSLTFLSIIMRYFLNDPFMFLEEVQKALLVWITMYAGVACFRFRQHVMIELVVDLFSENVQKLARYLMVVVVVMVLGFMAYYGVRLCLMHYTANRFTNVLQIPYWFIYSAVPIGAVCMIFQCIKTEVFGGNQELKSSENGTAEE